MSLEGRPTKRRRGQGIFALEDLPQGTGLTHEEMCQASVGFDHSCDPNVGPVEFDVDRVPFRRVLRDVKKGDELTVDYRPFKCEPKPCDCSTCRRD